MAKEVLQTHYRLFCNRTIPDAISAVKHNELGMPWITVSPSWRNLRKVCNYHLFSAKVLDANMNIRHDKIQDLLSDVRKSAQASEAVGIGKAAFKTALNLLSTTFFSMDLTDPTSDIVREFRDTVWHIVEEAGNQTWPTFFLCLRFFTLKAVGAVRPSIFARSWTWSALSSTKGCNRVLLKRMIY
ncbi:hypothetical protein TIFTF001_018366 [Ficus carica]|uniref:Uncharacterized protein n=1 Tax=Ficus carica TaxID=3494 RepID=A0AA88A463_FICCA|nr:hypothetical protein TIFTF001_018366 [Ficus carica]